MRILFVCMGNICRSPTAEGVFRRLVAERAPGLGLEIDSAGTHDYHVGEPPDARAIAAAARRGIDLRSLRARQVSDEDFARYDLILAMDRLNHITLLDRSPEAYQSASGCSWSSPAGPTWKTCRIPTMAGRSASSRCWILPRRPQPACSKRSWNACSPGAGARDGAGASGHGSLRGPSRVASLGGVGVHSGRGSCDGAGGAETGPDGGGTEADGGADSAGRSGGRAPCGRSKSNDLVVNVVTGNKAGAMVVAHPDIDKIAFTGSTEVGRTLRRVTAGTG